MRFLYHWPEGCRAEGVVNWRRDDWSRVVLYVRLWRLRWYFRVRSSRVGGSRILAHISWIPGGPFNHDYSPDETGGAI